MGTYFDPSTTIGASSAAADPCVLCTDLQGAGGDGVSCTTSGVSLLNLPIKKGYWRVAPISTVIEKCYVPDACSGGPYVGDALCGDGYQGPYSAVCAPTYASGIGYHCHACNNQLNAGIIVAVAFIGVLLLGLATFTLYQGFGSATGFSGSASSASGSLGAFGVSVASAAKVLRHIPLSVSALRIPIVVFQIIAQFTVITGVIYPPIYANFVAFLGLINLDFAWMLNGGCLHSFNYYQTLLLVTLLPIALIAALLTSLAVALHLVKRRPVRQIVGPTRTASGREVQELPQNPGVSHKKRRRALVKRVIRKHIKIGFVVSFLIYTTVSTVCFQAFRCDEIGGTRYLRADYSLQCSGHKYHSYMIYAAVMIFVYPIGIPALYVRSLWRYRRDFASAETSSLAPTGHRTRMVSFLWKPYMNDRFWWESVECGRRLLLTGFLVFILPNTPGQSALACVFAVASLAIFAVYSPLKDGTDTLLYITGCVTIFFTMFLGLIIKVQAADESSSSQHVLAVLLVAMNVVILVVALGQCALIATGVRQAVQDSSRKLRARNSSDNMSLSSGAYSQQVGAFDSEMELGEAKEEPHRAPEGGGEAKAAGPPA